MANILLLDDSAVAGRAMQGILARGNHVGFIATTPAEAWRMLREGIVFDLVFLELKLPGGAGLSFLQRLREDWFWKILPVVAYTSEADSRLVKRALGLKVQNYLLKPYRDESIYNEITKAVQNPWRVLHFEDAKTFCALAGLTSEQLTSMRRDVMLAFDAAAKTFPGWTTTRQNEEVFRQIADLVSAAEAAGVWAGVDYLRDLQLQAMQEQWSAFGTSAEYLEFASRLTFCLLNPSYMPESLRAPQGDPQPVAQEESARWAAVDPEALGPLVTREALFQHVSALAACPVIDSAAAAFQMALDGRSDNRTQVLDLVACDPGLCANVLIAANRIEHADMTAIEDPVTAANLLGENRLGALARSLSTIREGELDQAPLTWPNFWMFQGAVARLTPFICTYLDFGYLAANAATAGLLHDIGKLFLLKLHPAAFPAIVRHARERKLSLADAERKYLGCTTRELAMRFADASDLPPIYADVIRWVEDPAAATHHQELVAMVALARHICLHAHVGFCGETAAPGHAMLAATPAWQVLKTRVFPSFDLRKFEVQAHAFCLGIRRELSGQRDERRPTHAQRAAEMV